MVVGRYCHDHFLRFASALTMPASTGNASPLASPSAIQAATFASNNWRNASSSWKRPCRFLEKVE